MYRFRRWAHLARQREYAGTERAVPRKAKEAKTPQRRIRRTFDGLVPFRPASFRMPVEGWRSREPAFREGEEISTGTAAKWPTGLNSSTREDDITVLKISFAGAEVMV